MKTRSTEHFHLEVKKAAGKGLLCSQIIVDIGLRYLGMRSQCLIKGAGGLVGAMGLQEATCGALTGAACLLAFAAIDRLDNGIYLLIEELESRFNELTSGYPSNCCGDILDHDPSKVPTQVCPPIIAGAIQIALELLYGVGIGPERQVAE
jgi:hypothetical protein